MIRPLENQRSLPSRSMYHRIRRRPVLEPLEGRLLLTAGDLDTTFGGTGQVVLQLGTYLYPQGLAVQPDLKTVIVSLKPPSPGGGRYHVSLVVTRYNVDGSLDATFGSGGEVIMATDSLYDGLSRHNASVAIQPDGKLVVATDHATYDFEE